jgi:serine protease
VGVGTFTATITVDTPNGGSTTIPVLMRKNTRDVDENASVQYILLIDPAADPENQVVRQTAQTASGSTYSFTFNNVPSGDYIVVSGSDINNDGYICRAGEACGFNPNVITVNNSDVLNLSFPTEFGSVSTDVFPDGLAVNRRLTDVHR